MIPNLSRYLNEISLQKEITNLETNHKLFYYEIRTENVNYVTDIKSKENTLKI